MIHKRPAEEGDMYESVEHGGSLSNTERILYESDEFLGDISAKTAASLEIMILTPELA